MAHALFPPVWRLNLGFPCTLDRLIDRIIHKLADGRIGLSTRLTLLIGSARQPDQSPDHWPDHGRPMGRLGSPLGHRLDRNLGPDHRRPWTWRGTAWLPT